jgi:hypothetical protein
VNPAEAEDIREELRTHLDEAIRGRVEGGFSESAAVDFALASVGDPARLHACLDRVHGGDPWWMRRLKGFVLGMVMGGFLALLIPVGGHLEFAARLVSLPSAVDPSRLPMLLNGLLAGGAIGLLAAGGSGVLVGWSTGAVLWLAEYAAYWMAQAAGGDASSAGDMLQRVLLAPLLGGVFGAAVGAVSSAALAAASRVRPRVQ